MNAATDDRPALVARYLAELVEAIGGPGGMDAIADLGFAGRDALKRTALARTARGAIQYAGGPPLSVNDAAIDNVNPYGPELEDRELVDRARELGGAVLAMLDLGRRRQVARRALELCYRAGIIAEPTDVDVELVAAAELERRREEPRP